MERDYCKAICRAPKILQGYGTEQNSITHEILISLKCTCFFFFFFTFMQVLKNFKEVFDFLIMDVHDHTNRCIFSVLLLFQVSHQLG